MLSYLLTCLTAVILNIWGLSKIRTALLIVQRRKDAVKHVSDNIIPKDDADCKQFMRVG